VDFEAEGLLEGLEGEARAARTHLLAELVAEGVSIDELRAAVAEDRLAMLPVERVYSPPGPRFTSEEVCRISGLDPTLLERYQRALGVRVPGPRERVLTEHDLEVARLVRGFLDVGLPEAGILESARVIGLAMSQVARSVSQLVAEAVVSAGGSERDVALRFAQAARVLTPMANEILDRAFQLHQLELLRSEVIGSAEIAAGEVRGAREYAVGFADLVGFTSLGERLEPHEYGAVGERLGELAAEIAEPPVRLVKLIGDAAMLASRETQPLVAAALELQEAVAGTADLPELRVGVARGIAVPRAGDLYGRAVNVASRLSAIARPGSVLCDRAAKDAAGDGFRWSFAGARRLKGIEGRTELYRARPPDSDRAGIQRSEAEGPAGA
jgi:adenylate cyclase